VQQLSSTSVASASAPSRSTGQKSHRIAAIDWMRGLVMVLMVLDHSSMAFDRHHLDEDSAFYTGAGTMALPAAEFLTRWMTHICAPTFVFLAGTALALSVERRVAKGTDPWQVKPRCSFTSCIDWRSKSLRRTSTCGGLVISPRRILSEPQC
jgi:uncharacterized membrane protein